MIIKLYSLQKYILNKYITIFYYYQSYKVYIKYLINNLITKRLKLVLFIISNLYLKKIDNMRFLVNLI